MNELFYFTFADLMIRVEYNADANALRYASHRKITFEERALVEQYLLSNVALKTDYYKKQPSLFIYLGLERQLAKELNLFHLKSTLRKLAAKEKNVNASVEGLINQSMSNYYFEQIGDAIVSLRREVEQGRNHENIAPIKDRMEELVKAYNLHSNQNITITEVIPIELQPFLGLQRDAQAGVARVSTRES
ncbi:hypothetical protein KJ068_25285 [bacterium]|nr:hypothetical protein [bacterium]NUM73480.1 hypothetical protein [candidate division KSB1 bacterium]RIK82165.1 MAG: hypothetical protein DCC62_00710 [candidate division KSB1 bacterium]